ncbi:glycosyltransferase family 4 protein [Candidatus Falkowbacteria bacterium]|nr:glycosyltransferase family 4 protein [Candidatus Falkowbacteria bacterium]
MKILILNNLYRPFARGGAERIVEMTAAELTSQGHKTLVATTLPLGRKGPSTNGVAYYRGLPSLFYFFDKLPKTARLIMHLLGYLDFCTYRQTRRFINDFKPDLIISNNLIGIGLVSARAIRRSGIKHVHVLHDIQLLHPSGLLMWGNEGLISTWTANRYHRLNQAALHGANLVVSPSRWLLDLHLKHGFFKNSATVTIPNPIDFKTSATSRTRASETTDCLYVGQLETHKGIGLLLEAFAELPRTFRLNIAGSGSQKREVIAAAEQDDRIIFLGRLTPEQVSSEMERSSLLVVPSLCYENSPTVIYEAMSHGLPVIAADIGGIPELIADKENLFEPGNKQALITAITGDYQHRQRLPDGKALSAKQYISALLDMIKALD